MCRRPPKLERHVGGPRCQNAQNDLDRFQAFGQAEGDPVASAHTVLLVQEPARSERSLSHVGKGELTHAGSEGLATGPGLWKRQRGRDDKAVSHRQAQQAMTGHSQYDQALA